MVKVIVLAAVGVFAVAPLVSAETYKTPSQNSSVDQLHTTPSIMDDDGNINTDPAMTSSTSTTPGPVKQRNGKTKCQAGTASSSHPDNTDNPAMPLPCNP